LPEAWREVRIGLDVHVLNGPPQGTASAWRNLLRHLPPLHEYRLYSFDPALTARLFPERHFVHCRIPIHQPHVRIQLVYPWLARRDHCDAFHVNYYGPWLGAPGLVVTIHDVIYLDFPEYAPAGRRRQMALLGSLSARAARQITTVSEYSKRRIIERFGVRAVHAYAFPTREAIAAAAPEQLVAVGFSRRKAEYATGIARSDLDLDALAELPDDEIRARLVALPGIGEWTVDWFLARHLARPTAWPAGDLALRKALAAFYPELTDARAAGERFHPFENLTAHYLLLAYVTR